MADRLIDDYNPEIIDRACARLSEWRTWFLSRALENWLIEGGTFSRWYRICSLC